MLRGWTSLPLIAFMALQGGAVSAADDFLLARGRVGKLMAGMPEDAIYRVYPRRITQKVDLQLEGLPSPAVQVFRTEDRRHPSLVIRLDGPGSGIYGIEVMDPRFRTAKGIGAGSSFRQLRRAEKQLSFVTGEGNFGLFAKNLDMTFELATDPATERRLLDPKAGPDPLSIIPAATKIDSVWVIFATH